MSEEISDLRRQHGELVERVVRVETIQETHGAQLGKVDELATDMVRLNTQFSEFRDSVKDDLTALRKGQDLLLERLDADRTTRGKEREQDRLDGEASKKEHDTAKTEARDRIIGRLLTVLSVLAVIAAALITVYLHP